ncbi:helix-turn-helix transcriptional regulator [Nocardia sp. NPDC051750]|uniref:helix-turn-helix transcriptional regulator n=1 Tax=Nocardia sp. NPDC051750 TaxID=3364325 RepID=UPI0037A1E9CC
MIDYRVSEFSTDVADLGERPQAWAEHVREEQGAFAISPKDASDRYHARSVVQAGGMFKLAEFGSSGTRYRRDTQAANSDGGPGQRVLVTTYGRIALSQGRDTVLVERGSMGIVSLQDEMSMEHDQPAGGFFLTVPADSLTHRFTGSGPLLMDAHRPLVSMLCKQIEQISQFAKRDDISPLEFVKANQAAFTLLESALDVSAATHFGALAAIADNARMFVAHYADDPRLTPKMLADQLGWSERYLRKALRETYDTSPAALIRTTRAERACARLGDPMFRTIDQIWSASGFQSASAGREAFLQRYNMSPSQMRETMAAGERPC